MSTSDPLTVAETVLAPLRMLHESSPRFMKPGAIRVTPETFDAIVSLPEIVRELRAALAPFLRGTEWLTGADFDRARKALGAEDGK